MMVSASQAATYLDDLDKIDLTDSQNISTSGDNSTLPASKPIVLDDIVEPIVSGSG
jgi:hypothetical protein